MKNLLECSEKYLQQLIIKLLIPILVFDSFISIHIGLSLFIKVSILSILYFLICILLFKHVFKCKLFLYNVYTALTVVLIPLIPSNAILTSLLTEIMIFSIWYRIFLYLHGVRQITKSNLVNPINIATLLGLIIMVINNTTGVDINLGLDIIYPINKYAFDIYLIVLFLNLDYKTVNTKELKFLFINKFLVFLPIILIISFILTNILGLNYYLIYFIFALNILPPASVMISFNQQINKSTIVSFYIACFVLFKFILLI
ncbi:MAG: hypothetical protein ACK5KQ_02855 [Anaerorhabdus sp.]